MVKINRDEFNKDLDEYLSKRFDKGGEDFFSKVKKRFKSNMKGKKKIPERVELEEKEPEVEIVKEESEEIEEEEFEEKPGFWQRLFGWSRSNNYYEEELEQEPDSLESSEKKDELEEIKQVIKILHKWLEQLPSDKINQFKRSDDFKKYKESLDKLGLIKK